jgi:cysteine desulfurase/selenocysteine lyase
VRRGAEEYLIAEAERAESSLRLANTALEREEGRFREDLHAYVLHRFMLYDTSDGSEHRILALAEQSINHILDITGGDLRAAGVITGCGDGTTPIYKKIQLLFALQKAFSIAFDPARTAGIQTLEELVAEILRLKRGSAAAAGLPAEKTAPVEEAVLRIRREFPILDADGEPLIYLDNAATMQVPKMVRQATDRLYDTSYANTHRGVHTLGDRATRAYEDARGRVAAFLGADDREIVFTPGATAGLNLLAGSLDRRITAQSRVVVTEMDHHSNYLPWWELCKKTGAEFRVVPVTAGGELNMDALRALLSPPTALFAFPHVSNVLGTVNPVGGICRMAREAGVMTVVDGAQGIRHETPDVKSLGCDFYAFSGHKIMAGGGIGVLYGRCDLLEKIPPAFTGGGMIENLQDTEFQYAELPERWEAGTPNIAGAVSLAAALKFYSELGWDWMQEREAVLLRVLEQELKSLRGISVLGEPKRRAGCLSFTVAGMSAQDAAAGFDLRGIAVRAGHHCAIPLHRALGVPASVRVSPAFYNTMPELRTLIRAAEELDSMNFLIESNL